MPTRLALIALVVSRAALAYRVTLPVVSSFDIATPAVAQSNVMTPARASVINLRAIFELVIYAIPETKEHNIFQP